MDVKEIKKIKKNWPKLTMRGIRWYNKMSKQHPEDFLTVESLSRIKHVVYFLKLWNKTKKINYHFNSLDLKKYIEKVTEMSQAIPIGEVILALIISGYDVETVDNSAHVFTNVDIPTIRGARS